MKKLFAVLTLTFALSLVSHAAEGDPYFPGAWYATKAPTVGQKQAGGLQILFYFDDTLDFDIYLGGSYLETVSAAFLDTGKFYIFTLVDSDGWIWKGKLNVATGLLTGTFVDSTGALKGKFQCTHEVSESLAATGSKVAKRKSATP